MPDWLVYVCICVYVKSCTDMASRTSQLIVSVPHYIVHLIFLVSAAKSAPRPCQLDTFWSDEPLGFCYCPDEVCERFELATFPRYGLVTTSLTMAVVSQLNLGLQVLAWLSSRRESQVFSDTFLWTGYPSCHPQGPYWPKLSSIADKHGHKLLNGGT